MRKFIALVLLLAGCASAPPPAFLDGEQGRLFVSDGGSGGGIPVLFIHGGGANLTQWNAQLGHARRSRRAVALDLRGMGRSDIPSNGDYSIAAMIEDIHRVANALNMDRFVIVGHSYGGAVVASYAAAHPERVAGVVYADAAGDIQAKTEQWNRYLDAIRQDKREFIRKAWEPMLATASEDVKNAVYGSVERTSVEAFVGAVSSIRDVSIAQAVSAYKGPELAIAATDNPSSIHVQFPDMPVRRISGVGHWLMMEKPAEFNAILDEFLATIR